MWLCYHKLHTSSLRIFFFCWTAQLLHRTSYPRYLSLDFIQPEGRTVRQTNKQKLYLHDAQPIWVMLASLPFQRHYYLVHVDEQNLRLVTDKLLLFFLLLNEN